MNSFPLEILMKIIGYLNKNETRPFRLVNKLWDKAVTMSFGEEIHVKLDQRKRLFWDFYLFPLFAAKVVGITVIKQPSTWISVLKLCPNLKILILANSSPCNLLRRLDMASIQFNNLQEIRVLYNFLGRFRSERLGLCLWKFRTTITHLYIDSSFRHFDKDVPKLISEFPKLQNLSVSDSLNTSSNVNMHELLLNGHNIQQLRFCHNGAMTVCFDSENSIHGFEYPSNLKVLSMCQCRVHINTLRFLAKIYKHIERSYMYDITIVLEENQQKREVYDILKQIPKVSSHHTTVRRHFVDRIRFT